MGGIPYLCGNVVCGKSTKMQGDFYNHFGFGILQNFVKHWGLLQFCVLSCFHAFFQDLEEKFAVNQRSQKKMWCQRREIFSLQKNYIFELTKRF